MTKTIVDLTTASILEFIIESFKLSKFRLNCNWVIINSSYFVWFGLKTLYHKELIWPFFIFSFYTIIWTLSKLQYICRGTAFPGSKIMKSELFCRGTG